MPKLDLGEKQLCPQCGAKFYDLHKRPAVCPKCHNSFDPDDEEIVAIRQQARVSALDIEETPDDEDDEAIVKVVPVSDDDDVDGEEMTPEVDVVAIDEPELIMGDDGDDDGDINVNTSEPIPEGFSEQDLDEDDPEAEEEVPFIEGDDELFEEELAELDVDEEGDVP